MNAPAGTDWQECAAPGCSAARSTDQENCVAHLSPGALEGQLRRLSRGRPLDARGTVLSPELWERILDAVPVDDDGQIRFPAVRFDKATFEGDVVLERCVLPSNTDFHGARFQGKVVFRSAVFRGQIRFSDAVFERPVSITQCQAEGPAWFAEAQFRASATFDESSFRGPAWFTRASFAGDVTFRSVEFDRHVALRDASFGAAVDFSQSAFADEVDLEGTTFESQPSFQGTVFKGRSGMPHIAATARRQTRWWGPPLATGRQRTAAALVDAGVLVAIVGAGLLVAATLRWTQQDGLASVATVGSLVGALLWTWRELVAQGWSGQTLGKRLVGLRLLSETERQPVGSWHSIARWVLHTIDTLPLLAGWLRMFRHPKHQTFADSILGTVVVVVGRRQPGSAGGDRTKAAPVVAA